MRLILQETYETCIIKGIYIIQETAAKHLNSYSDQSALQLIVVLYPYMVMEYAAYLFFRIFSKHKPAKNQTGA